MTARDVETGEPLTRDDVNMTLTEMLIAGRGLHSSTFRLNVSAFCCIGGACSGCFRG